MRRAAVVLLLIGISAAPAFAQGRGRGNNKSGIPPGHMPAPGECRVWYDGRPPGQQPAPTSCREAERIAARERGARVIYGDDRYRNDRDRDDGRRRDDVRDRDRDRRDRDDRDRRDREDRDRDDRDRDSRNPDDRRAIPRTWPFPSDRTPGTRSPNDTRLPDGRTVPRRGGDGFDHGYRDGLTKGREDARDRDSFDPNRHAWYRSADRGYNSRYGSRDRWREDYRDGFQRGYEAAYRNVR